MNHLPVTVDPEDVLLPVADVLVLKSLERVGRWVIRHDRPRTRLLRGRPLWEAYLVWPVGDEVISKALVDAWDVIPVILARWTDFACLDDEALMNALDTYVHDLVVARVPHTVPLLRIKLDSVFPML